jgi:hypothetical protein
VWRSYYKPEIGKGVSLNMAQRKSAELRAAPARIGNRKPEMQSSMCGAERLNGGKLAVEYRPVETLIPYARNARTHSDAQVAKIAASIRAFGWTNPILIDGRNGIIAGHRRLLAARKLALEQVPVIELSGLSDADRRAYVLADNKLALNGGWEIGLLSAEVADLNSLGIDLSLAGFGESEVGRLTTSSAGRSASFPDEAPSPPDEPVSRPGDLWLPANTGSFAAMPHSQHRLRAAAHWPTGLCRPALQRRL